MASGLSEFTETHTFVSGIILVTVGLLGLYGAVSGNLATMLAALFAPTDIYTINPGATNLTPGVPGPSGGGGSGGGTPSTPNTPSLPGTPPALPSPSPPSLPGFPDLPVIGA